MRFKAGQFVTTGLEQWPIGYILDVESDHAKALIARGEIVVACPHHGGRSGFLYPTVKRHLTLPIDRLEATTYRGHDTIAEHARVVKLRRMQAS